MGAATDPYLSLRMPYGYVLSRTVEAGRSFWLMAKMESTSTVSLFLYILTCEPKQSKLGQAR